MQPRQERARRRPLRIIQKDGVQRGNHVDQPVRQLECRRKIWSAVCGWEVLEAFEELGAEADGDHGLAGAGEVHDGAAYVDGWR